MDQSTLSTAPWMGTWLIILLLFLFFMNGGNGFGGWGNNNFPGAFWAGINNSDNNHDNTVDLINNNTMWQNQLFNQQWMANLTSQMNMGFCNTNSNIDKVIYEAQKNTCDIITNQTANTQKILDMLCNQEITRLRTELAEARVVANNNAQTTELLSRLQPVATPSYIVSSPYTSIYPPTTTTTSA